jgi:rubrerythrin
MLRQSLAEEHEAVKDYEERGAASAATGDRESAALFRELAQDETHHIEEVSDRLRDVSKNPQRPPTEFFERLRPEVRRQYPSMYAIKKRFPGGACGKQKTYKRAIDCIIAGIWFGFSPSQQKRLARRYE